MSEITLEDIEGQLELSRQRFEQVITQIRTLLVKDISTFADKASKHAFLTQPRVSDALDEGRLKAFKAGSAALGAASSEALDTHLSEPHLWVSGEGPGSDERSLEGVCDVWAALAGVTEEVAELLTRYGYDASGVRYAPPLYFVGGLYLPTLVEHYWRLRGEMSSLEHQKDDLEAEHTRTRLASRWEDA